MHLIDAADTELYRSRRSPMNVAFVELGGARTGLIVPLRKDDALLGAIRIFRQEVRPFTDKQIALLQNFAAQAVIAMENARLIIETREALEQQTATAEVLGVINSSPGDLAPVFDSMLDKALVLCEAVCGQLATFDGEFFEFVALKGDTRWLGEHPRGRLPPSRGLTWPRIVNGEPFVQIADAQDTEYYRSGQEQARDIAASGGRTFLTVALRREHALRGALTIYRQEVRPFTEKQIALLQNFAAQAVIAMENARLITETREALEQQTATAEVLQVINSSPGDLGPVFDAMLEKAMRLCRAEFGEFFITEGEQLRAIAVRGVPDAFAEFRYRDPAPPIQGSITARILAGEPVIHVADVKDDDLYRRGDPHRRALVDLGGARTFLSITLIKDQAVLGSINIYRQEVRPFSGKQIVLLQNFAAQALIAMENARLITETHEALEQQTATAEVLGVINSSPGDLVPVFDAILEKAHTLCAVAQGALELYDGEIFRAVATRGLSDTFVARIRQGYRGAENPVTRPLLDGARFNHILDLAEVDHPISRAAANIGGLRTSLFVPLRRDGTVLGQIVSSRSEVRPFTDKQIALIENFAAQAVIAMENARLLTETREALEQQTATAEVLQVINASPGDLAPVFEAMLDKATRLCEAAQGQLAIFDGKFFRFVAVHGDANFVEEQRAKGLLSPSHGVTWPLIVSGEHFVHMADVRDTELYRTGHEGARRFVDLGGGRSLLTVALRKDQILLGALTIYRQEVRPFSDKQIALVQNFAAQAVIAMENARLITETREALEQQTATAEVLQVINSSPGDLAPVFDAMLDKATRLCEAAFGTLFTYDGECFHAVALRGVPAVFADALDAPVRPDPGGSLYRIARGEPFAHFADVANEAAFRGPAGSALVELGGARGTLAVPLRKDDALLGAFAVYRQEVRPFSDKQIALLQNFATQAVIAMENVRLITELRERTRDLQEWLEYQTATSDVLKVISRADLRSAAGAGDGSRDRGAALRK